MYNVPGMKHESLGDRVRNLPLVTLTIIAVNVIVYLLTSGSTDSFKVTARDYGLIPSKLLTGNTLASIGRMLSSTVIHDGVFHLVSNMALLLLFGRDVERAMGRLEFLLFYIGVCLASAIVYVSIVFAALPAVYAGAEVVGASGAVAGVMGVYAVRFHRKSFPFGEIRLPALLVILAWLIAQVVLGIRGLYESPLSQEVGRIGYWSHLGGFAFGIAIAVFTNMALQGEREYLVSEAQQHYDEGNLLESTRNYEALLRYDPDSAFAHAELGRIWAILDEGEQSLPFYGTAVELYLRQGKQEEALRVADEMRQFWPKAGLPAPTRLRLATYLEEEGEIDRAVAALRNIVETDGECVEAQMALLKIGQLQLSSLHDPQSAIDTLQSFLQRYPNSEWHNFAEGTLARAEEAA